MRVVRPSEAKVRKVESADIHTYKWERREGGGGGGGGGKIHVVRYDNHIKDEITKPQRSDTPPLNSSHNTAIPSTGK